MKILLCVICKNEENVIERCINSTKNIADEIIVIDTGLTDQIVEKAELV